MSQEESNELDCLIIEYKDKIEIAETKDEDSSKHRATLQFLKNQKEQGRKVPEWFSSSFNQASIVANVFSSLSRSIS